MLSSHIIDRSNDIDGPEEFEELYESFISSNAPHNIKEAAIKELKKRKNVFDFTKVDTPLHALKDIEEGAADIDDIGGMN